MSNLNKLVEMQEAALEYAGIKFSQHFTHANIVLLSGPDLVRINVCKLHDEEYFSQAFTVEKDFFDRYEHYKKLLLESIEVYRQAELDRLRASRAKRDRESLKQTLMAYLDTDTVEDILKDIK